MAAVAQNKREMLEGIIKQCDTQGVVYLVVKRKYRRFGFRMQLRLGICKPMGIIVNFKPSEDRESGMVDVCLAFEDDDKAHLRECCELELLREDFKPAHTPHTAT